MSGPLPKHDPDGPQVTYGTDADYVRRFRIWLRRDPGDDERVIRAIVEALNREIKRDQKIIELEKRIERLENGQAQTL